MTKRFADDINQQLTTEARLGLQTRIDLGAFLALSAEGRAACWRGWDVAAKTDAVIQMLTRTTGDWTEAEVEQWISHYDAKWGAESIDSERAVMGAQEVLADQTGDRIGCQVQECLDQVRRNLREIRDLTDDPMIDELARETLDLLAA